MKNALKFALAAAICAPKLALEDVLRYTGVKVPEKGLNYNGEGKSIMEIWNESGELQKVKESMRAELAEAMAKSGKQAIPTLMDMMNYEL